MSQANVEMVRAFYKAFNGGDFDRALECMDPSVELRPGVMAPDARERYQGRGEVRGFLATVVAGPWDAVTAESLEMIEIEDDQVLSFDRWTFQGRDGIEIERELAELFTLRNGLIARLDGFTDREEALEAAGLSE